MLPPRRRHHARRHEPRRQTPGGARRGTRPLPELNRIFSGRVDPQVVRHRALHQKRQDGEVLRNERSVTAVRRGGGGGVAAVRFLVAAASAFLVEAVFA